jgi:hypothetical protein
MIIGGELVFVRWMMRVAHLGAQYLTSYRRDFSVISLFDKRKLSTSISLKTAEKRAHYAKTNCPHRR